MSLVDWFFLVLVLTAFLVRAITHSTTDYILEER